MWTWRKILLYLTAVSYLLVSATASKNEYRKFLRQHHDDPKTKLQDADYCEVLMTYRRVIIESCKPYHIFIHTSEAHLRDLCGAGGHSYLDTGKKQSTRDYPVTFCRLAVTSTAGQCIYYATFATRRPIVTCDKNRLPVQLDEILTMTP